MAQIKAKVAAMGALQELRQDWGCQRAWSQDYLSSVSAGLLGTGRHAGAQGWVLDFTEHLIIHPAPTPLPLTSGTAPHLGLLGPPVGGHCQHAPGPGLQEMERLRGSGSAQVAVVWRSQAHRAPACSALVQA